MREILKNNTMNTFETFNRNFFGLKKFNSMPITWFDKTGTIKLANNMVATITIDDVGTKDSYNGYSVSIINTGIGKVASHFFKFREHLPKWTVRDEGSSRRHAWYDNNELRWYIDRPIETKTMVDIIFKYINQFL